MAPDELEYLQTHEMSRRDFLLDSPCSWRSRCFIRFGPINVGVGWDKPPDDEVVRIGYLPITDATVLLVAHAKGFFRGRRLEGLSDRL